MLPYKMGLMTVEKISVGYCERLFPSSRHRESFFRHCERLFPSLRVIRSNLIASNRLLHFVRNDRRGVLNGRFLEICL